MCKSSRFETKMFFSFHRFQSFYYQIIFIWEKRTTKTDQKFKNISSKKNRKPL